MSVSGITNGFSNDQISLAGVSGALSNARSQQLGQGFAPANIDVPSDVATFQQATGNLSASSVSGTLTAVQKAYESLQQIAADSTGSTVDPVSNDPKSFSGGPVRRTTADPNPIWGHDPMPPVYRNPVGVPNPISGHDPMPPVYRNPVGSPNPIWGHDPMPPVYRNPVGVPNPVKAYDPMPPVYEGTASVIA